MSTTHPPASSLEPGYLDLRALSRYAGVSVTALRHYLVDADHPLPHYRLRGKILVSRAAFDVWLRYFERSRQSARRSTRGTVVDDLVSGL